MIKMNVVWICVILAVFYHATGADGDIHSMLRQLDEEENSPYITQSQKDKLDQYRTTLIKEEILKMLGLKSPPNISHGQEIPKQTMDSVIHQTYGERFNADAEVDNTHAQVIVTAEPDSSRKLKNSAGLFLQFRTKLKLGSFLSATLVVQRNPQFLTKRLLRKHRLLAVRVFGIPHRHSPVFGYPRIVEINKHWIKLDITSIFKSKRSNNMVNNVSIEVVCEQCQSESSFVNSKKRRPFLIFNMKPATNTRKRRSTCTPGGNCCLVSLRVTFAHIFGGNNFIRAPASFYMNYCRGTCNSHGVTALFLNRLNILPPTKKTNPNDQCCVVSKMKPLSVLYLDHDQNIIKTDLPNMIATECLCA